MTELTSPDLQLVEIRLGRPVALAVAVLALLFLIVAVGSFVIG